MTVMVSKLSVDLKGRRVLSEIALAAAAGEVLGLIGPNGAGKSTLLRAMAGLLPVVAGKVTIAGKDLAGLSPAARAGHIAYLPQGREVRWAVPVQTLVTLGRLPHRGLGARPRATDLAAVRRAMAAMDVGHLAGRPVTELSGGELARVLMARALAQEAPVLLADEPAAGLDPAHQLGLFEVLSAHARDRRTVVVALHDLSLAARFCHKLLLLKAGRVFAAGLPREVLTPAGLSAAYGIAGRLTEIDNIPIVLAHRVAS
mgnify:CR=1 FL=1